MQPKTQRSIAILALAKSVPALITQAKGIVTAVTNNPNIPNPQPPPATITTSVNDLESAEMVAATRVRGAVATRNEKRAVLVSQLDQLKAGVQKEADANPEKAGSIIQSAGMTVRKTPNRRKHGFGAVPGPISGSVKLTSPVAARRASYEWEMSNDGGKTWQTLPVTLQAKTTVTGLQPGSTVTFRSRGVIKTGETDWSQPLSVLVH